jgi:hypothetical protein
VVGVETCSQTSSMVHCVGEWTRVWICLDLGWKRWIIGPGEKRNFRGCNNSM